MKKITLLKGGISGDFVYKDDNNIVYKVTKNKKRVPFIEKQYKDLLKIKEYVFKDINVIDIPIIENSIGNSMIGNDECFGYKMKFIHTVNKDKNFDNIIDIYFNTIKKFKPYTEEQYNFNNYIAYVNNIIKKFEDYPEIYNDYFQYFNNFAKLKESYFTERVSMCHGDLSIENILYDGNKIYLIDSNLKDNFWQSYLLDVTKIIQYYSLDNLHTIKNNSKELNFLLSTHFLRALPYALEKDNKTFEYFKKGITEILKQ